MRRMCTEKNISLSLLEAEKLCFLPNVADGQAYGQTLVFIE